MPGTGRSPIVEAAARCRAGGFPFIVPYNGAAERTHLMISTVDVIVIGVYLAVVVWLGVWVGRGNQNLSDYLLGSRDLPWWALLGSIVATETSTATFLSVPGLSYSEGGDLRFLQLALGYIVGRLIVSRFLLPAYFEGRMLTAYEVLHRRFGVATQRFASLMFLIARNVGDGLRLFLTAIALDAATGLSLSICVCLIAVVTILYTLFGGMKSVVWNDCVQLVVYVLGGCVTLWLIARALPGGWSGLHEYAVAEQKLRVFDFSWRYDDALTFWAGLVGGAFLSIGTHGTDQMFVQRLLSAKNRQQAAWALNVSGFVVFAQFALFLAIGIGLSAFFSHFPPPEPIDKGDEAYAAYIVDHMPTGLAGLALAAVFAAAMSTLSSSLNSSAAAFVNDFLQHSGQTAALGADRNQLRTVRILTVVFGLLQALLAFAASFISRSVVMDALAIAGLIAGPLLGVFSLGMMTERISQRAALCGMATGLGVLGVIKLQTAVAWPWYAVIGGATTFVTGWLVSQFELLREDSDDA